MADNVEQIKTRLDLVDLISGYLKVQKAGVNYKANCPFHNEKTPSFVISPSRQIWHCFGCSKGGDHFTFVQEIEGVDFPEALRLLAQRAGVTLERFDRAFQDKKTCLLEVSELATRFFEKQLWHSTVGQEVQKYLSGRGVTRESAEKWRLGYAPDSWQGLSDFLQGRGFSASEISEAGLAVKRENSEGFYDRFRSRLMFPIADLSGQIVGFTGRIFEPKTESSEPKAAIAKYVNTPQTLLYDKSRLLYGLDKAKLAVKKTDRCLVVEGNMDVILSHQAGVSETVASSGTALTDQHLKIIKRYTNNLDLCFDQDAAGVNAMERGIGLALQQNFNVNVIAMNDETCKDPADYVQKFGQRWQEQAKQTQPVAQFYLQTALKSFDAATALGKKMIVGKVLPVIKQLASAVERQHWLAELAMHLQVKEELLAEQLISLRTAPSASLSASKQAAEKSIALENISGGLLQDYLISLLMLKPDLVQLVSTVLPESGADLADLEPFLSVFKNYKGNPRSTVDWLIERAADLPGQPSPQRLETLYLQAQELWSDFADHDLELEFVAILNHFWHRQLMVRLADLEFAIKRSEKTGDRAAVQQLVSQFQQLAQDLNKIKAI